MENKLIVKSLEPLKTVETDNGYEINVWNRKYTIGSSPLFSSLISNGEEMLAGPMRVVALDNGKEVVWDEIKNFMMTGEDQTQAKFCQAMCSEHFVLNTNLTAEYDGYMQWKISVMRKGKTVPQLYGFEPFDNSAHKLTRLWIEVPLKAEHSKRYNFDDAGPLTLDGVRLDGPDVDYVSLVSGDFKQSIQLPFRQQFYLEGDNCGFGMVFESDQGWVVEDNTNTIEAFKDGDTVVMRIHLLDDEPEKWLNKENSQNGLNFVPVSFKFSMMATPIKPMPSNPYIEKPLHIDCYTKIPNDYEQFLFEPFKATGEIVFDRIQRLGINTLYIHEKWNDIQNSPIITKKTERRIIKIVQEAHKRGIKVIPYFGFEISSLSPIYVDGVDYIRRDARGIGYADPQWYRYPNQRDISCCYNADKFREFYIENIEKLIDTYNFDGLYLDATALMQYCTNEKHGCGYRDSNGNLHRTYVQSTRRELMKRLYEIVDSRGGTINAHIGGVPLYSAAFCHSLWNGESLQNALIEGKVDSVPEGHYIVTNSGINTGVPVFVLCYPNPPVWTFSQGIATSLPLGCLPKPVDTGEPLEEMSKIWKIFDSFPIGMSEFKPFMTNGLEVSNEFVKASYFDHNNKVMMLIANWKKAPAQNVTIQAPDGVKALFDATSGKAYEITNGMFTVNLGEFDYLILFGEK